MEPRPEAGIGVVRTTLLTLNFLSAWKQEAGPEPARQGRSRLRGGACRASLDRLSPARQGLLKQIRFDVSDGAPSVPVDEVGRGNTTCSHHAFHYSR